MEFTSSQVVIRKVVMPDTSDVLMDAELQDCSFQISCFLFNVLIVSSARDEFIVIANGGQGHHEFSPR